MATHLYRSTKFLLHDTGQHPESPARLEAVHVRLDQSGLMPQVTSPDIVAITAEQLARIHPAAHRDKVRQLASAGGGRLDADTVVSPQSYDVAAHAAGTAIAAVDAVLSQQADNALCLVRPPGHHALRERAMGFCLFNNVALAAAHARAAHHLDRVLIVDWDVHHGNGTQAIFYDDEHVHFFSAHRHPFYPGTGRADETGTGAGLGSITNLPLTFGISRQEYHAAFTAKLQEAADRCQPGLVLISAGFDAHRLDPIGSLGLETEDFAVLTRAVRDVADTHCEGHLVSLLEGGYNTEKLAESVEVHLKELVGANQ